MNLNRRILACILLMGLLAAVLLIGYFQRDSVPAMGKLREEGVKKIALTFDDGPHPYYTEQLLKGLKERNVKATFFITGKNVETYPEIVKMIHEDEHLIGNHTYNHTQLTSKNKESLKQEIIRRSRGKTPFTSGLLMEAGTRNLRGSSTCFPCSGPLILWTGAAATCPVS